MSASPMARKVTDSQAIPTRKILFNDPSELPACYCSTPGGTLYSTTPGGTKIVYEKSYLMNLRNSPISKTPPNYEIPSSLIRGAPMNTGSKNNKKRNVVKNSPKKSEDVDQFDLDL